VSRLFLDVEALYTAVDRQRRNRRMTWRNVAHDVGISPSSFTRLGHGLRPDADALMRLLVWLGATDHTAVAAFIHPAEPASGGVVERPEETK
jgi:hypothetical protein